ncbi:SDR family NAD(P)-dependent oxidoreductase [Rhodohalobacter sulfatireducens]|uniref:SDR family oxidoreductase n=1 Tax=Rhodohalobacter sulfatireducens TaxID=2911366 RepID=A0ABS9KGF5_9BACT|nr:SDR family oxidoreductase [Rhodohalobacter sulfatireducens]MCG2589905.1 SDR family oxidoreductase [Rhodohalobacter sulfatireducens]
MNLKLENCNCVVLGGSRGIGRSIATGLAEEGANVAICARGEEALRETELELLKAEVKTYAATCDIADSEALASFLQATKEAFGSIDVLVHNASALALGPNLEDWNASLNVDLMAAVNACNQVIPWMTEQGGGSIILVSSISGLECDPAPDYGYTAAKAALIAYAKKLGVMHAKQGIRANAIAPGSIEFPGGVWANTKESQPELYESVKAGIPAGRLGTPEEVADVAVFVASPRAQWITGECISVDGSQHRGMR